MNKAFIQKQFNKKGYTIVGHSEKDKRIIRLATKIRKEVDMKITPDEAVQIFNLVESTNKLKGDIAEVGTYEGSSAKIICKAKRDKKAYFFDTFEGLKGLSSRDKNYYEGEYTASFERVKDYLNYPNVKIIKGVFPKSAELMEFSTFSFVNLDVDIYNSTLDCLNFFIQKWKKEE